MCDELSLPELKILQKQHKIVLDRQYNKKELVESLKQRGVLPPDYAIAGRRVKNKNFSVINPVRGSVINRVKPRQSNQESIPEKLNQHWLMMKFASISLIIQSC
jgi:hypothetical protein